MPNTCDHFTELNLTFAHVGPGSAPDEHAPHIAASESMHALTNGVLLSGMDDLVAGRVSGVVCVLALLAQATGSMPPKLPVTAERAGQFGARSAEEAAERQVSAGGK